MLAWLLALQVIAPPAQASSAPLSELFVARAWGTADGLPQNTVTAIVQTRDGYLWLGTFGGLVRFDGHTFTVFDPGNTPGLSSARIVVLHEGPNGILWIGTESGLSRFENGRFTSFAFGGVAVVYEDRKGRVWVGGDNGLNRFDGRALVAVAPDPLGAVVISFAETPDGDVWVGTWHGVMRIDGTGQATAIMEVRDSFPRLFVDRTGRLWAYFRTVWRWEGTRFVEVTLPGAPTPGGIHVMTDDRDGNLWLGTEQDGVYRWHNDTVDVYNTAAGLTDDDARSVLVDGNGNIWIGTNTGGLNRLKRRSVRSYPLGGAANQSIGPITGDGADGLWIGGICGGLLHFRSGIFRAFGEKDGLPGTCVGALFLDAGGTLWLNAGSGAGLTRFQHGRFKTLTTRDGLASNEIHAIGPGRGDVLWLGTEVGLSRFDGSRFLNYGRAEGLEHDVWSILEDRSGVLWLGGTSGLSRFADGRFTRYAAQGLSPGQVRAIYEDADGTLWIGTYGGGLNRFKDGRFTTYSITDGLHDNAVSRIIEDDRGNLWMSGNKGVFRVARHELNAFADGRVAYITSVSYGIADGMIIDETNGGQPAGWRTPDGTLWFPTIKGLVGIEPDTEAAKPPPMFVERVVVNGQRTDPAALRSLGPGRADAEFHYTAVDLSAAEKTRFRYRLAGYDTHWIEGGTRRVAYYTGIPPGGYQFEVTATDGDGRWTARPARIEVIVEPFWWQRRAVIAAALLVLLAATGSGVRFVSLRRARARVAELERERALERERSRIARDLHDDLGSRLSHIAIMAGAHLPHTADRQARIADEANAAVQAMDELVWAVNARNDTVESFAFYVAQYAEERVVAAGLRCRLQLPPDLPPRPLGAEVRRHLYLAVKEAINNAVRHARASEIGVSCRVDAGRLVVEVADDGCGLPADVDPTGNGLKNLRERMNATGGTCTVESAPGRGTTLVFSTPV